jgi:ribose 5-phosphate isomerase A
MSKEPAQSELARYKQEAAQRALGYVESGMVVGLGGGTTALYALWGLAQALREGRLREVRGVPCSRQVAAEAERAGMPLATLEEHPVVDLTIDGADEVAPNLDVIKGNRGALLREKIVAQASRREVLVVDESKLSPGLGYRGVPLPVEVVTFGWRTQAAFLEAQGARVSLRLGREGEPYLTDEGNYLLDCDFGPIGDPQELAQRLQSRAGMVGHGLFLGLASEVIVAGRQGVRHLSPGGEASHGGD